MNLSKVVECPYCGAELRETVSSDYPRDKVILCESELGGCGRKFAAFFTVSVNVETMPFDFSSVDSVLAGCDD